MKSNNDNKFDKTDPPDVQRNESAPKEDATELMLVAYLDGELEEAERTELESQLASQPELRRRLDQLRQAWDLLDELEASPPSKRFAETTLEMVAIDAESHLQTDAARKRRALRRRRNRIGLGMLGALVAGFVLVWLLYPSQDAVLIRNLPVIQKLDQYESAESVEFLEALMKTKLFPVKLAPKIDRKSPEPKKKPTGAKDDSKDKDTAPKEPTLDQAPPIPASYSSRREWVDNLNPIQRAQLKQNWERFVQLAPEEREKLITLHDELAESEQSKVLTKVMYQYNEWLRRRSSFERTRLLDLSAEDRIGELRKLRQHALDRRGFKEWLAVKRKELKDRRAKDPALASESPKPPKPTKRPFANPKFRMWPAGPNWLWLSRLEDKDFADLKNYLSDETAKKWDTMPIERQRGWVRWVDFMVHTERGMRRRGFRQSESVSNDDLVKFYERLPDQKKSELLTVPGDQFWPELSKLYKQSLGRGPRRDGRSGHRNGRERRGRDRRRHQPKLPEMGPRDKDKN